MELLLGTLVVCALITLIFAPINAGVRQQREEKLKEKHHQEMMAQMRQQEQSSNTGRIKCPYCAELILPDAKICQYCGRDITQTAPSKNRSGDLGAYVANLPTTSDGHINELLQGFQDPLAYKRESAINEAASQKLNDPRIIGALEILSTSDKVDTIQAIAKRTLDILSQEPRVQ